MLQLFQSPCMPLNLPFPQSPEYHCGEFGKWELRAKPDTSFERGYFSSWGTEPPGHYLIKEGHIWMSTSRLERESHAIHLHDAEGVVVMCGVGMGMYLYNLAAKPEVTRVIAVDLDSSVVDLVHHATGFDSWPGREKIVFVHRNALELTPEDIGLEPVDYLYVDIWPELGDPQMLAQTQQIQSRVHARRVGWWGQEVDFMQWMFENRTLDHVMVPADLTEFIAETGLPLAEQSAGYLLGCRDAGKVYATYGSLPFARSFRSEN
jgi:hypothetical protein